MDIRAKAIIDQLAYALNQAQCTVAELSGEIAVRDARIAELEKSLEKKPKK